MRALGSNPGEHNASSVSLTTLPIKYLKNCINHDMFFRRYVKADLKEASNKEGIGISILGLVLIISPVIIILVRNAVATIQIYSTNLAEKAKELKREKMKSDTLLFQMLPPSVAQQLKQTRQVRCRGTASSSSSISPVILREKIASTWK